MKTCKQCFLNYYKYSFFTSAIFIATCSVIYIVVYKYTISIRLQFQCSVRVVDIYAMALLTLNFIKTSLFCTIKVFPQWVCPNDVNFCLSPRG